MRSAGAPGPLAGSPDPTSGGRHGRITGKVPTVSDVRILGAMLAVLLLAAGGPAEPSDRTPEPFRATFESAPCPAPNLPATPN
jgi:hypothetical protein